MSRVERPSKPKFIADESFIKEFENYAHSIGISSIGYTLLNSDLLLKDKFVQYPFTIVLTMEMDNAIIKTAPGDDAKDLNDTAYVKASILTTKLSDFLRKEGYDTEIAQPMGGVVNFSLLGQSAGLGHIGDSGLLITPELGPRLKVSAIFVSIANLPVNEENEHDWIPEYCEMCNKCVKACPEKALIEKESCCGNEIELIQKKCVGCSLGCTYCIEACPFEEKGYSHVKAKFDKINAKLREKQAKNFDMGLWNHWLSENSKLFTDLDDGFTMAIAMTDNENMIILNKVDNELNVNLKSIDELENSNADLLFVMDEKHMDELLKDPTTTKFAELLSSKKIDVYGLSDPMKLGKGYVTFLNKLGLSIGGECCG
ncbi:MAG: epoxyqueuosine reductase [Methanobacterium sp.]|nr:epoxyqueuosine reductase [Methanobacterium sp.]